MATKTISIDVEAYERLKAVQREGESFSRTIRRVVPRPVDLAAYARKLARASMSDEAIEAVEEQIRRRRRPSARTR